MASSGKAKSSGICLLINTSWCSYVVTLVSYCAPDLEYLTVKCSLTTCCMHEFTSATLTADYILPQVKVKNALGEIYTATSALETKFPKALFIVAGDFNQANLKKVLPKYHQQVSCPTRGLNILDHCYTTIKDAYYSIHRLHFGKLHHNAVLFLPAYKQKLKREDLSQEVVQCWSEAAEGLLWDCLESMDWAIFKNSADNLDEFPPPSQTSLT
eukprot:g39705.t1